MKAVYGMDKDSTWWAASDMGWVVGHSYICYGPLISGVTSVMYEGKPDRTPDAGQYFRYASIFSSISHFECPLTYLSKQITIQLRN